MILLTDQLKQVINAQKSQPRLFLRTLLKEPIQDYILQFVYNHAQYKKFLFTGGTALRKFHSLPRLSEDVDFDIQKPIEIGLFAADLTDYFIKTLAYKNVITKVAGNQQTVFLKFPKLLSDVGFATSPSDSSQLIVRTDISLNTQSEYKTQVRPLTIGNVTFFVQGYDLSTLFANKIAAFMERTFFRGKTQSVSFKGRDLFDLVWLFEQSIRSNLQFQPFWDRVYQRLGKNDRKKILQDMMTKVKSIEKQDVQNDLAAFLDPVSLQTFIENYQAVLSEQLANFIKL